MNIKDFSDIEVGYRYPLLLKLNSTNWRSIGSADLEPLVGINSILVRSFRPFAYTLPFIKRVQEVILVSDLPYENHVV